MSGAGFLMATNFFIALCFCFFFLAVSARSRNCIAARWFAGCFAVASLSIPFEFLVANISPSALWTVLAFSSMLCGAFMLRAGIGHLYGIGASRNYLTALFFGFVVFNGATYELPRGTLAQALAYQAPLAFAVSMSAWVVWRAGAKAFADRVLGVLLVMTSLYFPLKAVIAVHVGSGTTTSDYLSSRFALYSQSIGAVLIVTIGLVLLCALVLEIMADEKANAEVDVLSGLLNRRGFDNHVDAAMALGGPHSIVICDLDHFKSVNDTYGHQGGDAAIRAFGEMLTAAAPDGALVARIGGEEFLLFLPRTSREAAMLLAHTLRAATAVSPVPGLPAAVRVTASFGVAETGSHEPLRFAMRRADDALYVAKKSGRDCVCEAEPPAVVPEAVKRVS